jgi:hypothetical protein
MLARIGLSVKEAGDLPGSAVNLRFTAESILKSAYDRYRVGE